MNIDIVGIRTKISEKQAKYINQKIGNLEKYLPRAQREFVRAEVRIKEIWSKQLKQLESEITLKLPGKMLIVRESADSAMGAVDAARDKLKLEIKKYKETRANPKLRQRLVARYRRRGLVA